MFKARFTERLSDGSVNVKIREFPAKHITHARKKAQGIAKAHGWTLTSIGAV